MEFGDSSISGTFPIISNEFLYGEAFRDELYDAKNNKEIELSYQTIILKEAEVV